MLRVVCGGSELDEETERKLEITVV